MKKTKKRKEKKNEEESLREIKVRVIGVGGGGGSIISGISGDLQKVCFAAVNTDIYALEEVAKNKKIKGVSFGKNITSGLGTGMDASLGKKAAIEDIEEIKPLFKDQDIVIFVSSFGGGTGSGALPVFSSAAKEMGCLTYGVFTLPFSFEGEKKVKIAKEAVKETAPYLHAITILPNEKIFEIVDKNTPLKEALMIMNKNLSKSIEGLIETIYDTGLINIDFADVRTVLGSVKDGRKMTYLSSVEGNLEEGAEEIVKRAVSNELYPYTINRVKCILFNIIGGKDIGLTDVSTISESISKHTEEDAKIIVGIMQKNKYKDKVKISVLATGCETDFFKKELGVEEKKEVLPKEKKENKKEINLKKIKKRKEKKEEKKIEPKEEKKENKEKKDGITIVPRREESFHEEKKYTPENEDEREIIEEEKKWERPSFLRNFRQ